MRSLGNAKGKHSLERFPLTTKPRYQAFRTARKRWWRMTGSNRRPPACKAGALPAELIPPRITWWVW
ncbi:protein of unknown function [Cupriavidus taiwanensis]|nr:protein of unknown function [Cupriavidus taiwanensis]SPA55618.1 protein of unknown function [Cupriavidus taiwanensis]